MTDEEHYNAMAESMNQDTSAVVTNPALDVDLPKTETPREIAQRNIDAYKTLPNSFRGEG
jgi:hypothetical protein